MPSGFEFTSMILTSLPDSSTSTSAECAGASNGQRAVSALGSGCACLTAFITSVQSANVGASTVQRVSTCSSLNPV